MNKVQTLVICKKQLETQEEFKQRLVDAITVLLDSEYILKVKADESDIIVIEYEHEDQSCGTPYPYWLTPEQAESVTIGGDEE